MSDTVSSLRARIDDATDMPALLSAGQAVAVAHGGGEITNEEVLSLDAQWHRRRELLSAADPMDELRRSLPTPGVQGAIATFEMFRNFLGAGFTEQQALFLTAFIIKPTSAS